MNFINNPSAYKILRQCTLRKVVRFSGVGGGGTFCTSIVSITNILLNIIYIIDFFTYIYEFI